jgi:hypothetical protein
MIDVYVREANRPKGEMLGEFKTEDLPRIIKSFQEYPTYLVKTGDVVPAGNPVEGRYVHDKTGVYFTVVLFLGDDT